VDDPHSRPLRLTRFGTAQGLSTGNLRTLAEDALGRLCIGTVRGLDRLDPGSGHVKHYTTVDGLASSFVASAHRDAQGRLWFGTFEGLSRLDPQAERPRDPPPVWIGGLEVSGVPRPVAPLGESEITGLELEPGRNHLHIDFLSLAFGAGEAVRFQ
jgi:hypothetical protein